MGLFSFWTLVAHSSLLKWLLLPVLPPPPPNSTALRFGSWVWLGMEGREGLHPLAAVTVAHHVPLLPVLSLMSLPLLG